MDGEGSADQRSFAFLCRSWWGEREFWIVGLLARAIIARVSRLRQLVLSDRCRLAHGRVVRHAAVRFSRSHNFVVRQPANGMPFFICHVTRRQECPCHGYRV
jgi:hypothetical protein